MQQTPRDQETSRRDFFKKAGESGVGGSDVQSFIDGNSSTDESHSGFRQLRES